MKCRYSRILAYLLSVHNSGIFGKFLVLSPSVRDHEYLKHMFLLSVFIITCNFDFYPSRLKKLNRFLNFIYEFFMSLMIFDLSCIIIWHPILYTLRVKLPETILHDLLGMEDCCCFESYCGCHEWPMITLLYLLCILFFYGVIYSHEIISFSRNESSFSRNERKSSRTGKWWISLKRIHHGIMCTDVKSVAECPRCKNVFRET